jgi:dienelactone hydrolase
MAAGRAIRVIPVLATLFLGLALGVSPLAHATSSPRLTFSYNASGPLRFDDRGPIGSTAGPVSVHDVSFRSQSLVITGYLALPREPGRHPGVVLVHGAGGTRADLLEGARQLAARNVVALSITAPSSSIALAPATTVPERYAAKAREVQIRDVIAVRRAVDALQSLPEVAPTRIGFLGRSAGGRTGMFLAAAERRIRALALLSAPAEGSIDPLPYLKLAQPGSILLENGRHDGIVPRSSLLRAVRAAPKGTTVRWYDADHVLNKVAYRDAFAWLAEKLRAS